MLPNLPFWQIVSLFLFSAVLIWYFSNKLSAVVEIVNHDFNLGEAFGGTIMLSIVTNLPELVIVVVGVIKGDTSLALGNILGGIAMQTLLLVLFDFSTKPERKPLTTLTSNNNSLVQGVFLCIILALVIMGTQLNATAVLQRTSPVEILIFCSWILSLLIIRSSEKNQRIDKKPNIKVYNLEMGKTKAVFQLVFIAVVILIFGVVLADTSETIAAKFQISGVIFGATVLALVTSLPEISGGLAFVKSKEYEPIISDIFGGNAFLPVLFLIANVLAGHSILTEAKHTDIYLTGLSLVLVLVFLVGMIIKSPKKHFGLGIDSWAVLVLYILGIGGLMLV